MNVFKRVGLGEDTYITFAAGGAFTKFSHEFQVVCEAGEDITYINRAKGVAINEEVLTDETLKDLGVTRDELEKVHTAEVGNIFNFGQQKATDLGLTAKDADGNETPVWIGSYGIGITRLMGVLVEKFADEKGIVWPKSVAPFQVHLVMLGSGNEDVIAEANRMYDELTQHGIEVLFDDRDLRAGEKFADAELIGIPTRIVVSEKTLAQGGVEVMDRKTGTISFLNDSNVIEHLSE